MTKYFGDYVKHSRFRLGLTIKASADKVGISEVQMCRIENGQNKPSASTFAKLVEHLEMDEEKAFFLLSKKDGE